MNQGIREIQTSAPLGNCLESYRRLVELQKEMIQLAQQNEHAKRACSELREQVTIEAISRIESRRTLRLKAYQVMKQSPVAPAAKPNLASLQLSTC